MNGKTNCPICSTDIDLKAFKEVYISPFNNQEYKRYVCPKCDIHWWGPLKIIPEFYESEVFDTQIAFHDGMVNRLKDHHKAFFKYFPTNVKGKLLDIGCGDGRFIKHAKEQGFEVFGIDFDQKSIEKLKENPGIDTVFSMSFDEFYEYAKTKGLKFDVITFFEVLEHQDKPRKFLEMVKELLNYCGYTAGSVPNRESISTREMHVKKSWIDFPPHHFLRFSKPSLEKTLSISGFKEIEIYKSDFPFEEILPFFEKTIFGNDKIKIKIKSMLLGDERKAKSYYIEELSEVESKNIKLSILKVIKNVTSILLLPLLSVYVGGFKDNGFSLYFQATI